MYTLGSILVILIPFVLTGINIFFLNFFLSKKRDTTFFKWIEPVGMFIGLIYLYAYVDVAEIKFVAWDEQLYNNQRHSMLAPDYFISLVVLCAVAFVGYCIVRFIPASKQSPIVSAVGIAAIYIGIGICVVWCIQTILDVFLFRVGANYLIIFIRTIYILVYQKNNMIQQKQVSLKYEKISEFLNKAVNLPWIALIVLVPILGIVVALLFLFGQEPSNLIKIWTNTSGWSFSQYIAPQNAMYDEHYLCTVAAGGHQKVVKPIRGGVRHGHKVIVNRQLCVANAFEQILEEKVPKFHKFIRGIYDATGYPISRHIRSKYTADIIYFLMKPLEYFFLLVLYTVDVNPENRIAVQYPHTKIPQV